MKFDKSRLKNGMILHVRTFGWIGRLIRIALGARGHHVWGNHDGLLIFRHGQWWVGESVLPVARLTLLADYESREDAGKCELRVYDIVGAKLVNRLKAVDYWLTNVCGSPYDCLAFPRLLLKAIFGDVFAGEAGWEWAHWCTEGVAFSWDSGANMSVWKKENPTPLTTEKRVGDTLIDITEKVSLPLQMCVI